MFIIMLQLFSYIIIKIYCFFYLLSRLIILISRSYEHVRVCGQETDYLFIK